MKIFRKRYIPNEIVDISGDEVLYRDEKKLITKWKPIKKRIDIGSGKSCVYFEEGFKVSKFLNKDGTFKFWYCDIIDYLYDKSKDEYIIIDLLLDVVVYSDGSYEVLDEDELTEAFEDRIITEKVKNDAIEKKEKLIGYIENGIFDRYTEFDEKY